MAERMWAVIPAAGVGSRMGSQVPKQYHLLGDRSVLEHSLAPILTAGYIDKIVLAIAQNDKYWPRLLISRKSNIITVEGGQTRAKSVLNALAGLKDIAREQDWVLVHDAVRPCFEIQHLTQLITAIGDHPVGGILGVPVRDTLKKVSSQGYVLETIERENLWQAQTPQLFRYGILLKALRANPDVTDEASAIEALGLKPMMVQGSSSNIKVTYAEDFELAKIILQQPEDLTDQPSELWS